MAWDNSDMADQPPSIVARFTDTFISGLVTMKHHLAHGILAIGVAIYDFAAFGRSWQGFKDHLWEEFAPCVWAVSIAVAYHAIRSATRLVKQMKSETNTPTEIDGIVFTHSGKRNRLRIQQPLPPAHFKLKIWGTAACLVSV